MKLSKFLIIIALLQLGAACSDKYRVDAIDPPAVNISAKSSYYVMLAENGRLGQTHYEQSGKMVSTLITAELEARGATTTTASAVETLSQATEKSKSLGIEYIFQPKILHWEDRATEWSSRPDRITMAYKIFSVPTGELVASTTVSASSKWATFGGDHPQDLVPKTVSDFMNTVAN
ncbi:MAG: hypothetical protein COB93_01020 [Sneathiella sp.]|nr:MAG: hypothetical protein COB93_01020 [Sneathiella sp.]